MSNNVFEYTIPWDKLPPENIEEEVKNQVSKFSLTDASKISLTLKCTPENFKMEIHKNINMAEVKGITNATVKEIDSKEPTKFKKAFNEIVNSVVKEQKPVKLEFIQNLNESISKNNINNMNTGIVNDKCNSSGNTDKKSIENQESSNLIKQDIDISKEVGNKNDKISLNDTEISEIESADNKLVNDKNSVINKNTENDIKSTTTNLPSSTGESVDANTAKDASKPSPHEEQKIIETTIKEDLKKQEIIESIPLVKDTKNIIKEAPKEISKVATHEKETTDDSFGRKVEISKTKEREEISKPSVNKEEPIDVNKAKDITKPITNEEQKLNVGTNIEANTIENPKKQENTETVSSVENTENKDGNVVKKTNKDVLEAVTHEKEATDVGTQSEIESLKVKENAEAPKSSTDKHETTDTNLAKDTTNTSSHKEQKVIETTVKEDPKKQENIENVPLVKDAENKDVEKIKEVPKEIQEVVAHEKEPTVFGTGCEIEALKAKENAEAPKSSTDKHEITDANLAKDTTKPSFKKEQKIIETDIKEDSKKQGNVENISLLKNIDIVKEIPKEAQEVVVHEKKATDVGTGREIEASKAKENTETLKSSTNKEEPSDISTPKDTTKSGPHEEQKMLENDVKQDSKKQENMENVSLVKDADKAKEEPKEIQNVAAHEKKATDVGSEKEAPKTEENVETPKSSVDKDETKDANTAKDSNNQKLHEEQKIVETTIKEDPKKQENIENVPLVKDTENNDTDKVKEAPKQVQEVAPHEKETTDVGSGREMQALKTKENVETPKSSIDKDETTDANTEKDSKMSESHEEQKVIETKIKEDSKIQENIENVPLVKDGEHKDTDTVKEAPKQVQEFAPHEKEATNVGVGRETEVSKTKEIVETSKSSIDNKEPIDVNKTKDTTNSNLHEEQIINAGTNKETTIKEDLKTQEDVSLVIDAENKDENVIKEAPKEVVAHEKEATNIGTGQEIETLKTKENVEAPKSSIDKEEPTNTNTGKDSNIQKTHEEQKIIENTIQDDPKKQEILETVSLVKDADKIKDVTKEIQEVAAHEKETTDVGSGREMQASKTEENVETPKSSVDKDETKDANTAKDSNNQKLHEEQKNIENAIKEDPKKQENIENVPLVKDAENKFVEKLKEMPKEIQEVVVHEKEPTVFGTGCEIEALKAKENTETLKTSNDKEEQKDVIIANDTTKPSSQEEQKIIETDIKEDPKKQENTENVPLVKDSENKDTNIVKEVPKEIQEVIVNEKEATNVGTGQEMKLPKTRRNVEVSKSSIDKDGPTDSNNKHEIKEENEKKNEKDCQIATDNESKISSPEVKTHEEPQKNLEDPTQESNSSIIANNKETENIEKKENIETPNTVSQQEPILSNASDTNEKKEQEQILNSTPDENKLRNNISEVDKGKEIPEANTQENSAISTGAANNEIYEDSNNVPDLKTNEVNIETKTTEIKKTDGLSEAITQEDIQDIVVEEEKKEENVLKVNELQIKASADISENELEEQIKEMPKNFAKQYIQIPSGVDENIVKNDRIKGESQKSHDQEGNKNPVRMIEKTNEKKPKDNVKSANDVIVSPIETTKIKENEEPAKLDEKIENKALKNLSENKTQEDSKINIEKVDVPSKIDEINKNEESLKLSVKDDTKISPEIPNEKVGNQIPEALKPKSIKEIENDESKTNKSEGTKEAIHQNVDASIKKDDIETKESPDNPKLKNKGTRKWSNLVNPLLSDTNEESLESTKKSLSKASPNDLLIQSDTSNSSTSDTLQSIDNTENLKINNKKKRCRKMKKSNPNENEEKSSDLNLPLIIGLASIAVIATIIIIRRN
uniref:MSP domain-containing protein n=1 Tax=Strongyloides papillosus TaxID=174720 RepID=A0A0N5C0K5_STREA